MADIRSEVSRYPSRYSPQKYVTASQYIVELVCEKNAQSNKMDLPMQFWKQDQWAKYFAFQSMQANRLLKKYSAKAIIDTIKAKNVWTLRPKWVEKVIAAKDKEITTQKELVELQKAKAKPVESVHNTVPQRRTSRLGTTALDKLLALDLEETQDGEKESGSESRES